VHISLNSFDHEIVETDFVDYIRGEAAEIAPDVELVEYVNRASGRHAIAMWISRERGTVIDVANYHPVFDPPSWEVVHSVLLNLNNDLRVRYLQQWLARQRDEYFRRHQEWAFDEAYRNDYREYLRRHEPNVGKRDNPLWWEAV
jgi:hypothetical protein